MSVSGKTLAVGFWHMEECGKNVFLQKRSSSKISYLFQFPCSSSSVYILTVLGKCFTICNSQDEINFKNSNFSSLDASSEGSLVNPEIKGCPWMDCN